MDPGLAADVDVEPERGEQASERLESGVAGAGSGLEASFSVPHAVRRLITAEKSTDKALCVIRQVRVHHSG